MIVALLMAYFVLIKAKKHLRFVKKVVIIQNGINIKIYVIYVFGNAWPELVHS